MAYTVNQVAKMSGASVRTLHFYDETALLKPAYCGANGYRFYEEPQLLRLQQILFYRELGFDLKRIKELLGPSGQDDIEKVAALASHRKVLEEKLRQTQRLIETIDHTTEHLKGGRQLQPEELFAGFSVAAGQDRFDEGIRLGELEERNDCKVSARDTNDAMCIFEFSGVSGGPRHLHYEQDEWIYVLEGTCRIYVGDVDAEPLHLTAGGSIFIPRTTPHVWGYESGTPCTLINVYQPAGRMEDFFRELSRFQDLPTRDEALTNTVTKAQIEGLRLLFDAHGMKLLGPPRPIEGTIRGEPVGR